MGLAVPAQVTPQQALWQRTYKDVKNHSELDSNFEKLRLAITQHVGLLQRQAQVRVKNWLKKLSEETANVVWKKNRNAFARLLLEQLRAGRLAEPFHQMPPDGPLPTLPKHAAYAFAQPRNSPPAGGSSGQARRLSASEALDEYLGRQDFRQLQLEGDTAQPSPHSNSVPQPQQMAAKRPAAAAAALGAADVLPGTRMPLMGAESLGVDRPQLADTRWQPSKLELEAQLGASRERERELQWRLQQAEEALRQQSQLLPGMRVPSKLEVASPASLINDGALDDGVIDDGHVSPPRRRRIGRREVQELIDKHEARRRAWRTPTWHRGSAGGRITPLQDSDEEEILEHLDNFQRQTEAIRRHLARRSSGGSSSTAGGSQFGDASLGPPGPTLSAMSSGWEAGLGLGLGLGPGPASTAAAPLFSTAAPSLFSSRGPEPSLSVAGGLSARTPRYASAAAASPGSTVADGATPSVTVGVPPALLATARPPMRPAGLAAPLLDGLPQSPHLGAGWGPQQQQQPAVSSGGSVSFGGGHQQDRGNSASTPPQLHRPASPTIRHTLKSAAAAQRTASSLRPSSPASSSAGVAAGQARAGAGAGAASQPRRHGQGSGAAAPAEPMPASAAAAAYPVVTEGSGQSQQEGWQQQGDSEATPTSRPQNWSPRRQPQQQQQHVQQGGDTSGIASSRGGRQQPQPQPEPDPNSFAHLASGAADLRRRLEQQMGAAASAGGAVPGPGPSESSFADLGGHTSLAGLGLEDHLLEPSTVSSGRPGALGLGLGLGRSGSGGSARLLEPLDSWDEDAAAGAGIAMGVGMGAAGLGVGGLGRPRSASARQMLLRPSTKYRLSSDAGTEGGSSSAGGTPRAAALGGGGGGGGKYRLTDESSLGGGSGTGWGLGSGDSSLEDFRRQTEAIRAQIAVLGGLG